MLGDHAYLMAGALEGKRILDAACGTGIISRLFKNHRAAKVTGVDISLDMINQARQSTCEENIHYISSSIEDFQCEQPYDLTVNSFLFNEAKDVGHLKHMIESLFRNLRPGGYLVANVDMVDKAEGIDLSHYGITLSLNHPMTDGSPFHLTLNLNQQEIGLDLFFYSSDCIKTILEETGFQAVEYFPQKVTPEGIESVPSGFWDNYINRPASLIFRAMKP